MKCPWLTGDIYGYENNNKKEGLNIHPLKVRDVSSREGKRVAKAKAAIRPQLHVISIGGDVRVTPRADAVFLGVFLAALFVVLFAVLLNKTILLFRETNATEVTCWKWGAAAFGALQRPLATFRTRQ